MSPAALFLTRTFAIIGTFLCSHDRDRLVQILNSFVNCNMYIAYTQIRLVVCVQLIVTFSIHTIFCSNCLYSFVEYCKDCNFIFLPVLINPVCRTDYQILLHHSVECEHSAYEWHYAKHVQQKHMNFFTNIHRCDSFYQFHMCMLTVLLMQIDASTLSWCVFTFCCFNKLFVMQAVSSVYS